jgi:2-polyprenyl-3-methyl-5-hydroxy-6-metoxy-1,4-benzoquinol methylase
MKLNSTDRDWEKTYRDEPVEALPWYYPDLDPDVKAALDEMKASNGRLLDLGTGPGTQAVALARMGFTVTASDLSSAAIEKAGKPALEEGLDIEFVQDDILDTKLSGPFDYILDRGCFHTFPPEKRNLYLDSVTKILRPGGILLLKCFSAKETGEGPHRFTPGEIRWYFEDLFEVISIKETSYPGTRDPSPISLFCILRRK